MSALIAILAFAAIFAIVAVEVGYIGLSSVEREERVMTWKCQDKGGCPFVDVAVPGCKIYDLDNESCHLTPADFPIIDAMIAGEWSCEKCVHFDGDIEGLDRPPEASAGCDDRVPCIEWQPKEA